jgi:hypothetical protein
MAIAIEVLYPGATTEQYDAAVKALGLASGGEHPGACFIGQPRPTQASRS